MSSYYEEHACAPLQPGQQPDHLLHFARLLLDGGFAADMEMDFESLFPANERRRPPAAKRIRDNLPSVDEDLLAVERQCSICLRAYGGPKWDSKSEAIKQLPCDHRYHGSCIQPWLERINTCPLCRHELPTDDPDYEEYKKQKKRNAERKEMLEDLHNSMFG